MVEQAISLPAIRADARTGRSLSGGCKMDPMAAATPEQKLESFLDKFEPAIAAEARAVLAKVRSRINGATEMVYDNTYALVIGFGPNDRPSDAVVSVVVYPRYVMLYFLYGAVLPDPAGLLAGKGKIGRHIRLESAATLDDPTVRDLIDTAVELNEAQFDASKPRRVIIKLEAPKQRPRRPPPPKAKRAARY